MTAGRQAAQDAGAQRRPVVLFVCTANQCRSPTAELLLRHYARRNGLCWEARSAGTAARDGMPIDPRTQAALRERGIAAQDWVSHRLRRDLVDDAALILTADRGHRSAVAAMEPSALSRTWTLLHFARLVGRAAPVDRSAESVDELLARARLAQATSQPWQASDLDIADPTGRSRRAYRRSLTIIEQALSDVFGFAPATSTRG